MTCIAWDGVTLASDKRSSMGGMISTTTKLYRLPGCIVGVAGDYGLAQEMVQWIAAGCDAAKFPASQKDKEDWCHVLVISMRKNKVVAELFERSPYPLIFDQDHIAIGSGREFARAAMYLGKTAREAVEVACALSTGCGNGIDTMTLEIATQPGDLG